MFYNSNVPVITSNLGEKELMFLQYQDVLQSASADCFLLPRRTSAAAVRAASSSTRRTLSSVVATACFCAQIAVLPAGNLTAGSSGGDVANIISGTYSVHSFRFEQTRDAKNKWQVDNLEFAQLFFIAPAPC